MENAAAPACRPFRIHSLSVVPYIWQAASNPDFSAKREDFLVTQLAKLEGNGSFLDVYRLWKEEEISPEKRLARLECLYFYAQHDTDGDGTPDWASLIDQRPAYVLFPQDDDIDGDGTPNLLDPDPFHASRRGDGSKIPSHLVAKEKKLQAELLRRFGILAVDQSDQHSPEVLRNLLFLLEHRPGLTRGLKNLRYLYAFASHDRETDIAAYHLAAKAISIGGVRAFPPGSTKVPDAQILSSLAHEIGHAFLLEKMKPAELSSVAKRFGNWEVDEKSENLYAAAFFRPHPLYRAIRKEGGRGPASAPGKIGNLVSSYAATNVHEWFAEAFAASALVSLGENGLLGKSWRNQLITRPRRRRFHWVNYNYITPEFSSWLRNRINSAGP